METGWWRHGGGDRVVRQGVENRVVETGWWRQGDGDKLVKTGWWR